MKKYFITIAFFLCLSFAEAAEARIIRGSNECGFVSMVYTNNEAKDLGLLCAGDGVFDTEANEVAYIVVNGKACYPNEVTEVTLDGGSTAYVTCEVTANGPIYKIE